MEAPGCAVGLKRESTTGPVCRFSACISRVRGRELFRFASEKGGEMLRAALLQARIEAGEVDWVVVHQANLRIIESLQQRSGIAPDRWLVNIGRIGNTAAASVLIALADLLRTRIPADGARILLGAFGAGLTWCAAVLEWGGASLPGSQPVLG